MDHTRKSRVGYPRCSPWLCGESPTPPESQKIAQNIFIITGGDKLMSENIKSGTLLIKDGTLLPESIRFEGNPYLQGWRLANLDSAELDRKLCDSGWTFFYMAGEVDATSFGGMSEKTITRAVKKLIANMKSPRFNCLEISRVAAKSFLGLPYVAVAGHLRHIQESIYLFHAKRVSEWDRASLAP